MLNEKQRRFVAEYLIDLNSTQAAIRAGYSAKTAKQQGSRLLTNADVQAAVVKAQTKRAERTEITQDRVLAELAKIGFADMRKLLRWTGNLPQMDLDAAEDSGEVEISTANFVQLAAYHTARWSATVKAATGVELGALIGPADMRMTVEAAVERNVALVRSVSDQARQRIADAVFRGFQQKKPAREVAAELREAVAMGRRRALLIASDQTTTLGAQLNQERMREAGIDSFIWRHSGKLHPREEHVARNGVYYTENAARVGNEYQGKTLLAAPPADERAGVPIHCGCVEQSLLIID